MRSILVLVLVGGLTACGSMSKQGRDTAIGAGLGAAAGAAVTKWVWELSEAALPVELLVTRLVKIDVRVNYVVGHV